MKAIMITFFSIFLGFVLILVLSVWSIFFGFNTTSSNIDRYTEMVETKKDYNYAKFMPSLNELGEYEDVDFRYYHKIMFIFQSEAYTLKVAYDDKNFETEKEKVLHNHSYCGETPLAYDLEEDKEKTTNFTVDTFDFKTLSVSRHNYPKELIFIGISEETNEIAYVCYYDPDLDYIDTDFETFLKEECGW